MKTRIALPLIIFVVMAQQISAEQMILVGLAKIDDKPIPKGAIIVAKILDKEVGKCNISEMGGYSITIETNETPYAPIEFYTDGYKAIQVVPFEPDKIMVLDLNFRRFEEKFSTSTTIPTTFERPSVTGHFIEISTYGATLGGIVILLILAWYTFKK